jgi:hypothetical protein
MGKEQDPSLLQITARYVSDVQSGRQPRLSDYLASYPRYADAIADFVAYYHAVEETASTDGSTVNQVSTHQRISGKVEEIDQVSANQAIICQDEMPLASSQQDEQAEGVVFARTMTTLLMTATGQRLTFSQIAAKLDLSRDILLLLEQRAIAPATIPHVLYEKIAMLLQQPIGIVQQYFDPLDQRELGPAVQKRKQPMKVAEQETDYTVSHVVDKPSFRAIVETSLQLSTEQRNRWCAVLDAEGI